MIDLSPQESGSPRLIIPASTQIHRTLTQISARDWPPSTHHSPPVSVRPRNVTTSSSKPGIARSHSEDTHRDKLCCTATAPAPAGQHNKHSAQEQQCLHPARPISPRPQLRRRDFAATSLRRHRHLAINTSAASATLACFFGPRLLHAPRVFDTNTPLLSLSLLLLHTRPLQPRILPHWAYCPPTPQTPSISSLRHDALPLSLCCAFTIYVPRARDLPPPALGLLSLLPLCLETHGMQPLVSAMATFRKTFLAAIVKSLLRGKTLIQAILAYCMSPLASKQDTKASSFASTQRTVQEFLKEAEALLLGPISGDGLRALSDGLKKQYIESLQTHMECMLPSYSYQLPEGTECGRFLSLDVGGSTLRVALVELRGRVCEDGEESKIISIKSYHITPAIKDLEGMEFFNWMAQRISDTLEDGPEEGGTPERPLPMALAWSFPIEQTSLAGGKLQGMGKGFLAHRGLLGQDLGQIIKLACKNYRLNVELRAIVNDSSACLLSRSYSHNSTRFGLILGTGVNLAAFLPISAIGRPKFGLRPASWFQEASHIIVNTELSMFGTGILPLTRWDKLLLKGHPRPTFQPLEYMVSGMYLGEICRFALIEAIESTGVFGGVVPSSLRAPYSLGTETISRISADTTPKLVEACKQFASHHPSPHVPNFSDMFVLKELASLIAVRSSALIASSVYSFWDVRRISQEAYINSLPDSSPLRPDAEADLDLPLTTVAFNGSVIEQYPGYLTNCQRYLDELAGISTSNSEESRTIQLVAAKESSLLGAAVALACVEAEN
ncbi:hypothetical protein G7046_g4197 [Stylonectria norvegica]|nr:hypothetical protein G7046_g4197 [Stylonectria norvegica]